MSVAPAGHPFAHFKSRQMKTQEYRRWKIGRMWGRDNRCHWCNQPTILVERSTIPNAEQPPRLPNEATIDHLDPRGSPERGKHAGEIRQVLSCNACNDKKNEEFWRSRSLEELWRQNGHWPRMAYQTGALPGEVA